jgi:hypothetical protein
MTKEKKKKRSRRSRSYNMSLPPIMIPSDANRIDIDDDDTTNVEGGGSKCKEYICEFIYILSTFCYLCSPPIVMLEIYNLKIAPILGFGLFLIKIFVLDLILFHMGKIQYWPITVSTTNDSFGDYYFECIVLYIINKCEETHLFCSPKLILCSTYYTVV